MIKIEKLKDGAKVFVVTEGSRQQVYLNQLITAAEFQTIEVEGGTLVYSIDEAEVKEIQGQGKQLTLNLTEVVEDKVVTADQVEATTITAQPAIIKPTPRARK